MRTLHTALTGREPLSTDEEVGKALVAKNFTHSYDPCVVVTCLHCAFPYERRQLFQQLAALVVG